MRRKSQVEIAKRKWVKHLRSVGHALWVFIVSLGVSQGDEQKSYRVTHWVCRPELAIYTWTLNYAVILHFLNISTIFSCFGDKQSIVLHSAKWVMSICLYKLLDRSPKHSLPRRKVSPRDWHYIYGLVGAGQLPQHGVNIQPTCPSMMSTSNQLSLLMLPSTLPFSILGFMTTYMMHTIRKDKYQLTD